MFDGVGAWRGRHRRFGGDPVACLLDQRVKVSSGEVPRAGPGQDLHRRRLGAVERQRHRSTCSTRPREVIGPIPDGTAEDVDRAAKAARRPRSTTGRQTSPEERAKFCTRIAEGLGARMDEIATIVTREAGMPKWLSLDRAGRPARSTRSSQAACSRRRTSSSRSRSATASSCGSRSASSAASRRGTTRCTRSRRRSPTRMAAGCTVVLKPSEVAPLDAFILAEVINDVGLPAGVFNLVTGTGPGGRRGHRRASRHRHGVVHRLDPRRQARRRGRVADAQAGRARARRQVRQHPPRRPRRRGVRARPSATASARRYLNSGQTCTALTRMLVPQSQAGRRRAHRRRRGRDQVPARRSVRRRRQPRPAVVATPRSSACNGYIQKGIDEGAKLVTGGTEQARGPRQGYYVQPTVFSERDATT